MITVCNTFFHVMQTFFMGKQPKVKGGIKSNEYRNALWKDS